MTIKPHLFRCPLQRASCVEDILNSHWTRNRNNPFFSFLMQTQHESPRRFLLKYCCLNECTHAYKTTYHIRITQYWTLYERKAVFRLFKVSFNSKINNVCKFTNVNLLIYSKGNVIVLYFLGSVFPGGCMKKSHYGIFSVQYKRPGEAWWLMSYLFLFLSSMWFI